MNKTSIEWTDYTWNPVTGCHKVSQGCKNCYAETMTNRFAKTWGVESFRQVVTHPDRLNEPLASGDKLAGKKIFVCDMSDLFHKDVSFRDILRVFRIIDIAQGTYQILTKRIERALEFFNWCATHGDQLAGIKNYWLGVSCEDQATADQRIPLLLKCPAPVRFLSCEPLLGPIDLCQSVRIYQHEAFGSFHTTYFGDKIHWVIAGGESGHGARPMHPDWVRSIRDQCAAADVPFLFKQWGKWLPYGQIDKDGFTMVNFKGTTGIVSLKSDGHYRDYRNVGKTKSGNFLDGKQHLEFPKPLTHA